MGMCAIIPARGGSKRLPRKNVLLLDDKPLMAHVIDLCKQSKLFDHVIVSTEDKDIAELAYLFGAEVEHRHSVLATDTATVNEVACDLIEKRGLTGAYDQFCIVYSTAVLLSANTLQSGCDLLDQETNFVMGVSEYNFPPVQALKKDKDGFLSYQFPEFIGKKSQEHPSLCVSNGSFYMGWCRALLEHRSIYGPRLRGLSVPQDEVCDVDYPEDFESLKERYYARK